MRGIVNTSVLVIITSFEVVNKWYGMVPCAIAVRPNGRCRQHRYHLSCPLSYGPFEHEMVLDETHLMVCIHVQLGISWDLILVC